MDVQDQAESTVTVTMASQYHVDMRWNSAERTLDIDDVSRRYIEPAMSVLMSHVDGDVIVGATKAVYNTVGTAGTKVGTVTSGFSDTSAIGDARAKLNQYLAPPDSRVLQLDSITMSSVANGIKVLNNPPGDIGKAWREGYVGRAGAMDWYENERTWTLANSDDVAGTIDESAATNFVQGATTLHVDALGTTAIPVGAVFTIAGMYACHPETKQAYSHLQQFVVTTAVTPSSNECDIVFSPAIYTTGAKMNVCSAAGAELTWTYGTWDGIVVTFLGSASTSYRQNLAYHPDFCTFVTADLPLMDGADKCVRQTQDGLSLRVWQDGDIRNDELLLRIDMLFGYKVIRPAWACRITN